MMAMVVVMMTVATMPAAAIRTRSARRGNTRPENQDGNDEEDYFFHIDGTNQDPRHRPAHKPSAK
jgi:hypothetical protein